MSSTTSRIQMQKYMEFCNLFQNKTFCQKYNAWFDGEPFHVNGVKFDFFILVAVYTSIIFKVKMMDFKERLFV